MGPAHTALETGEALRVCTQVCVQVTVSLYRVHGGGRVSLGLQDSKQFPTDHPEISSLRKNKGTATP